MKEPNDAGAAASGLAETTVNELIRNHPNTVEIFNRFGIDACCGGGAPVLEAAARDGADPRALTRALIQAIGDS